MVIVLFSSFDPTINELNIPNYRALTSPDQINGNANITTMEFPLRCSNATIIEWSVLYNSCNPALYIPHVRTPACGNSMPYLHIDN